VIPASVRAVEASRAVAEAAGMVFPTLAALPGTAVLADAGPGRADEPLVAAATTIVLVHRQAQQSARAAAVRIERLAERFERLTAQAADVVLAVIGSSPFDPAEIAAFAGGSSEPPPVFALADDPLAAAVLAGRSGVSPRRLTRLPLLRTAADVTRVLASRIATGRSAGVATTARGGGGR
jgi:hypothetical protein